jgi:hypothetical protein
MAPKPQGRGWSDIAYSFLVGGGQIFEGRGVGIAGGHTAGRNSVSHAICLIGDYTWMVPKQEDLEAIAWLMAHGKERGWWRDLTGPHREAPGASTACCGTNLIACIPDLRRMASTNPQEDPMGVPQWAKTAWDWAVSRGIVKDRPNDPATRAEVVAMLHRAMHDPDGAVPGWAVEAYRSLGGDINEPQPSAPVTEARLVTLLHRWGIRSR